LKTSGRNRFDIEKRGLVLPFRAFLFLGAGYLDGMINNNNNNINLLIGFGRDTTCTIPGLQYFEYWRTDGTIFSDHCPRGYSELWRTSLSFPRPWQGQLFQPNS
jgi:hypothetical protein